MAGLADGSRGRPQRTHVAREQRRVCWKSAARPWVFLCLLLQGAALGADTNGQPRDSRDKRAGDVAGLEDGRISLARVSAMLTSSVHTEVRQKIPVWSALAVLCTSSPRLPTAAAGLSVCVFWYFAC